MKVNSGLYRGMNLFSPKNNYSRPTESKVKSAIINMLYPIDENKTILDLFSCTGQMGIEFLSNSRNSTVIFSDNSIDNISILKKNLKKINNTIDYIIFYGDYTKNLKKLYRDKIKCDYIFLDPPYNTDYLKNSLNLILKYDLLNLKGYIITESDKDIDYSEIIPIQLLKQKKYGRKYIKIYIL